MVALSDRILMTAEEYFAWDEMQEQRYEYWDGEVVLRIVAMAGALKNHIRVVRNFSRVLDSAFSDKNCEVFVSDMRVQVNPSRQYFYPDVVVSCDDRDTEDLYLQYPCLIVEVFLPSTESIDRGIKFAKYRQIPNLMEYVLVRVKEPGIEVFRRNENNQWVLFEYGMDDRILLESVNVEITVAELYRQVVFEPTIESVTQN